MNNTFRPAFSVGDDWWVTPNNNYNEPTSSRPMTTIGVTAAWLDRPIHTYTVDYDDGLPYLPNSKSIIRAHSVRSILHLTQSLPQSGFA